ncbi:MAG: hydrogenase maturation nickel metallochaperone HypA [Oscillospiraceae bacterium]|nr:hydrogenase maturation nickel metallochaperone HypA [Oscillospiraceae bacterium]
MHEMALTQGILAVISSEQKKSGFSRVREIRLKIGEYSGVIPSCIETFFPLAAEGTAAEGASLVLETVPAAFRCPDCGYEGPVEKHTACCPDCGGTGIRMTQGREFFVENLAVE